MQMQVFSITQVNEYLRSMMDRDPVLMQIAVRGEISNYKMYPSGHHYFSLKDENATLKGVLFRMNAARLRFRPENGMRVIAVGRISVYPRDGAYQLVCTSITPDGVGDLHVAFEQLKTKLEAKGMFDTAHKKPLPQFPKTIGIVTSSAGAAIHDILRILNHRYPLALVRLIPVRVQGEEAPPEIAAAIRYANQYRLADVLIVGRGGGSMEDLWAFNDERVACAIYESNIPVISAVGHEPDVTISDYVADLRAATPSNAAELVVPDQSALLQNLDAMSRSMAFALQRQLKASRQRYAALAQSAVMQTPLGYLEKKEKDIELYRNRLIAAQQRSIDSSRQKYIACISKLDALSPLKVLSRGYSLAKDESGHVIRSVKQINISDRIEIVFSDGSATADIKQIGETER